MMNVFFLAIPVASIFLYIYFSGREEVGISGGGEDKDGMYLLWCLPPSLPSWPSSGLTTA